MAVAGMGEPQGQIPVVAKQQSSAAVGIESAHRMEPLAPSQIRRQQIQHGGPSLRIVAGGEHPNRLVEQKGERDGPWIEGTSVDADLIVVWIRPLPQGGRAAVQAHPALPQ